MPTATNEINEINKSISEIGSFVKERTDALTGSVAALTEEKERLQGEVTQIQERMRRASADGGCARRRGRTRYPRPRRALHRMRPSRHWHHARSCPQLR